MAAALRTIEASVSADGVVTTAEPVFGSCKAVLTILVNEKIPNAVTHAAMDEPTEGLRDLQTWPKSAEAGSFFGGNTSH
jgi:hypothetical protein